MSILESRIEEALDKGVKEVGGFTRKTVYQGRTSAPDRQVFLPKGRIYFVELKQTGKKPRPSQQAEINLLRDYGFKVYVIDSIEGVHKFINEVTNG